ncbi:MAG: KamA family radical SAM protein [Nanoarchaeota archaeon]|nr:KamA family radical SAM protein [Nanoarchaeota archaeon]
MDKKIDDDTGLLIDSIIDSEGKDLESTSVNELKELYREAESSRNPGRIIMLFQKLLDFSSQNISIASLGFFREDLERLALLHQETDEYGTTVAARLSADSLVKEAQDRIDFYIESKHQEKTGIELDKEISENRDRIKKHFGCSEEDWLSFSWQMKNRITDAGVLGKLIDLPEERIFQIKNVQEKYRMSITPYYASLIIPGKVNDPILVQCVPDVKEVTNPGQDVAAFSFHHSPARLIDQIYPQVCVIKVTNVCAMYCRHCLRTHDIGFCDKHWTNEAFEEAFDYIKENGKIRDVLLTGGDALSLSNERLGWVIDKLMKIDTVKTLRIGTRMPVTVPQRIDDELIEMLAKFNRSKPIRMPMQINCSQEITNYSQAVLHKLSDAGMKLICQTVLLKHVNDSELKMWKLCETLQEAKVRPYYVFNCSYRDVQFRHLRVPIEKGRKIIRGMIGNLSGDIRPTYIATAGGKIPLHEDYVKENKDGKVVLQKPWNGVLAEYPDADEDMYCG